VKPRHAAAPADKRQLDAIIKALERTRDQVGRYVGAGAGSANSVLKPGQKPSRPAFANRIYNGIDNLLRQAREERSKLKD
jgi:hypothetical protein